MRPSISKNIFVPGFIAAPFTRLMKGILHGKHSFSDVSLDAHRAGELGDAFLLVFITALWLLLWLHPFGEFRFFWNMALGALTSWLLVRRFLPARNKAFRDCAPPGHFSGYRVLPGASQVYSSDDTAHIGRSQWWHCFGKKGSISPLNA